MINVRFNWLRARELHAYITNDHAVSPPQAGWTTDELLALAGACQFMALAKMIEEDLTRQQADAVVGATAPEAGAGKELAKDIIAATNYYMEMTGLALGPDYNQLYDQQVEAEVSQQWPEITIQVKPKSGFRTASPSPPE